MTAPSPTGSTTGPNPPGKAPRDVPPGWARIIGGFIGALALVGAGFVGRATAPGGQPTPSPTVTVTATPSPAPGTHISGLGFALPPDSGIPFCSSLAGSGRIPKGYSLAIFDAALGPTLYFHFDGTATQQPSSNSWILSPFYIGAKYEKPFQDQIVAVLLPNKTVNFIKKIRLEPKRAFWVSLDLPSGQTASVQVIRDRDSAQCASS
jgi:hypothetical protein